MAVLMYAVIFLLIVLPVDPLPLDQTSSPLKILDCASVTAVMPTPSSLESYSALTALRSCRTLCFVSFVEREAAPTALLLS